MLLLALRALPRRAPNVFLLLPFVLGWPMVIGFLSFEISLALGVLVLALGWRLPPEADPPGAGRRIALASALYLLSVWFHPAGAFLTGFALLLLEWKNVLRWREWPRMLAVVGPGAAFVVATYLTTHSSQPLAIEGETFFSDPLSVLGAVFEYNIGFTPLELVPRIAALALLVPGAYRAARAHSLLGSSPEAAVGRVAVVLLAAYFALPGGTWAGWAYFSARFLVYGQLLLPLAADLWPSVERRLLVVGPALAGVTLAIQWPFMHRASVRTQDVVAVGESLPRDAKLIPVYFDASVLGPEINGDSWAHLVVSRSDAVASQLFAAGRPRMGGERFRMVSFLPGVLDVESGALPWSDFEMWNDIGRACAPPGASANWFVHTNGSCSEHLADRKGKLEKVVDRYDYVLMLDPPSFGREILPAKLRLVDHVGAAWLYAVASAGVTAPRSGS